MRKHLYWILPVIGYGNCFWIYWLGNGEFRHGFDLGLAGLCGCLLAGVGALIALFINSFTDH